MPEAAVDEYSYSAATEEQVWSAAVGNALVDAKSEPGRMQGPSNGHFWCGSGCRPPREVFSGLRRNPCIG